ncbi:hypothetical protein ACFVAQ_43365 [Streptomyces sp. NPDC057651]|uniref:hypothetical protein n=1 Tax=Streptomyces sp. NPDC057651 TaxID=3346194 RepID=UPI00367F54FF
MDFILMTEGDTPVGLTHERVGFDAFGSSEQHVALGTASVSAPEVLYPYLMALTNRTDGWSDEWQPRAALANVRTVFNAPAAHAVREVWNG